MQQEAPYLSFNLLAKSMLMNDFCDPSSRSMLVDTDWFPAHTDDTAVFSKTLVRYVSTVSVTTRLQIVVHVLHVVNATRSTILVYVKRINHGMINTCQLLLPCSRVNLFLISAGNFPNKIHVGMRREPYVSCDCPSDSKPRLSCKMKLKYAFSVYLRNANYEQAICLLKDRFGQQHMIINAFMQNLLELPCPSVTLNSLRAVDNTHTILCLNFRCFSYFGFP
jgi:hypothetical protein